MERDYAESLEVVALADVLLHPSRSEGFGMLVLEAQHVGVPVITTRRGAMKVRTQRLFRVDGVGVTCFVPRRTTRCTVLV